LRSGTDLSKVHYVPTGVRSLVTSYRGRTSSDGPVLVYQTSASNQDLFHTLCESTRRSDLSFLVYGAGRASVELAGRIVYRAFSERSFVADLARAPFVITNGGHTTIVEALALGKPVLAEPIGEHYEQAINAYGLQALGVGQGTAKLSPQDILEFARRAPELGRRARALELGDSAALVSAIEHALLGAQ
jgi:uncharacterized protein (TIGR00661 family)